MKEPMLQNLKKEIQSELSNILGFWSKNSIDEVNGGFIGKMDTYGKIYPEAEKGGVLNARILWTFSAAAGFETLSEAERKNALELAHRAFEYFKTYFIDQENGGVYWSINADSSPKSTRKQIYGLAFAIYGLSEFYKVSENEGALALAIKLFQLIENHSFDKVNGGYWEAFTKDWELLEDLRLSEKDRNDPKTMNTHLHIIEAYVNLYKVWNDAGLKTKIEQLLEVFEKHIIDQKTGHMKLFFDQKWNSQSAGVSYGHDIEAAWLLHESAEVLGNEKLTKKWENLAVKMADTTIKGFNLDGSLNHEKDAETGHLDTHREWWVSAEAMIGFLNAYQISKDEKYIPLILQLWEFTKEHLIDHKNGEWFWGVYPPTSYEPNYQIMDAEDKVGFWKCPYHNTRACMELVHRLNLINS
jgi:cellobiose epimerase